MKYTSIIIACLSVSLMGCTASTQEPPKVATPFTTQQAWWSVFNDPVMNQLAEQLSGQNLDIKIAQARLEEAQALTTVARSAYYPDISATGNAMRGNTETPGAATILQGGFNAAWELDVFGRTRAGVRAAEARITAQAATVDDVRNLMLAELLRAVTLWRQAHQTLQETQDLLHAQDDQVSLLEARAETGLIDTSFVERARAQRAQTATQIPLAEAAANAARYQMERLLGVQDERIALLLSSSPAHEPSVPTPQDILDVSLDTIKHRPDIRAAQANMLAAQADMDKAEADLWPRFTLGGFFGAQDVSDSIRAASNPIWSLASGITAPIFNFGRLRGAVNAANARSTQAVLQYENTVLLALQETRTALSDYLNGINTVQTQAEALARRRDTVNIAKERFDSGLTDMTDLTTAQAELDQATIALIERKAAAAIAYIRLQKALGTAAAKTDT